MRMKPARMPWVSAKAPMVGRMINPGTTKRFPTVKPKDRTLGGMASESVAKIPATSGAPTADVITFMATESHSQGETAITTKEPAITTPKEPSRRRAAPGLRRANRVRMGVPTRMPTSWNGSATAAMMPRWASLRW